MLQKILTFQQPAWASHNYFNDPTKLSSDLYLAKFVSHYFSIKNRFFRVSPIYLLSCPIISIIATRLSRCRQLDRKYYDNERKITWCVNRCTWWVWHVYGVTCKMLRPNRWHGKLIWSGVRYAPFAMDGNLACNRTERRAVVEINVDMCKQLWIINMMRSTDSDYHLI